MTYKNIVVEYFKELNFFEHLFKTNEWTFILNHLGCPVPRKMKGHISPFLHSIYKKQTSKHSEWWREGVANDSGS